MKWQSLCNLASFLERDVNYGFSGGEVKRSEMLQLLVQNPDFVLLDEPESGVDLENIALIGDAINRLLQKMDTSNRYVLPARRRKADKKQD